MEKENKVLLQEVYAERLKVEEDRGALVGERQQLLRDVQEERLQLARERGDLLLRREAVNKAEGDKLAEV